MSLSSRLIDDKKSLPANFLNALAALSKRKFIPAPDGVLIEDTEGYTIGAIGIRDDSSKKRILRNKSCKKIWFIF